MDIKRIYVESKAEMQNYLNHCNTNILVIGEESEVEEYECVFEVSLNNEKILNIGVITEGHGLKPECLGVNDKILIGFNREVRIICNNLNQVRIGLDSLFYEFFKADYINYIIAIFELEIICFSLDGEQKWIHYCKDSINNYYIDNEKIFIITDSGKEVVNLIDVYDKLN